MYDKFEYAHVYVWVCLTRSGALPPVAICGDQRLLLGYLPQSLLPTVIVLLLLLLLLLFLNPVPLHLLLTVSARLAGHQTPGIVLPLS